MGASLGIGLGAAMVLALINAIIINSKLSGVINMARTAAQGSTALGMPASVSMPNFFQVLVSALISGVAGSYSLKISAMGMDVDKIGTHILLWGPMTLSGVALLLGAAFGAYLLAHKTTSHFKWDGIANSVVVGLATGLIYVILGAIFPLSFNGAIGGGSSPLGDLSSSLMSGGSKSSSANGSIIISGATPRTFLMATVFAGLGALLGFALAQYAPDSTNAFKAAWRWGHRLRGFARTAVEALSIYTLVYTVLGLVAFIILAFVYKIPSLLLFIPSLFPLWPLFLLQLSSFGGIGLSALGMVSGNLTCFTLFGWTGLAKISGNDNIVKSVPPELTTPGALHFPGGLVAMTIVLIIVFIVTTLYIALRASARNMQDHYYMDWKHTWKQPVAAGIFWLFITFASATGISVKISGVAGMATNLMSGVISSATGGIDPSKLHGSISLELWYFLVAMIWAFLIEVVAMTFGPTLVASMPGIWKIFKGGQVEATPAAVRQYVDACDARFGKDGKNRGDGQGNPGGSAGLPWPGNPNGPTNPVNPDGSTNPVNPGSPTGPQGSANGIPPLPMPGSSLPIPSTPTSQNAGNTSSGADAHPAIPAPAAAGQTSTAPGSIPQPAGQQNAASPQTQDSYPAIQIPPAASSPSKSTPASASAVSAVSATPQPGALISDISATDGVAAKAKPMTASQKRILFICLGLVALCAALGITYGVLNATVFSPKTVVSQYTDAIASGRFDDASSIADPQIGGAKSVLLHNNAAKPGNFISNQHIVSSKINDDGSAYVDITYTLAGKEKKSTIKLVPNGSQGLIFKKWAISTPLVSNIKVDTPKIVDDLTINDVDVSEKNAETNEAGSRENVFVFAVYPGTYTVGIQETDYLKSKSITLEPSQLGTLDVKATKKLSDSLEADVKKKLDKCATSTDAEPKGCPFSYPFYSDGDQYRNFSWSILKYPQVTSVDVKNGTFDATTGRVKLTYQHRYSSISDDWDSDDYEESIYYSDVTFWLNKRKS